MRTIWQDMRYGLRGIVRQPAFAGLAVLTLALGIGAVTTICSVIHNVLLNPFPYTNAHRFATVQVRDTSSARPGGRNFFRVPEFLDYQEQNTVFDEVIGGRQHLRLLGTSAHIGRTLTSGDAKPGAPPVFVMSNRLWRAGSTAMPGWWAARSS